MHNPFPAIRVSLEELVHLICLGGLIMQSSVSLTSEVSRATELSLISLGQLLLSCLSKLVKQVIFVSTQYPVILPEHLCDTKGIHYEDGNPARAYIKQALGR
ncbi:hypothetical protein Tco_1264865 [Tanacetum coccineum]